MSNNSSPFEGLTCGVRFLGPTYKIVLLGFPLYFMDRDQAKLAAQRVLADFGVSGMAEGPVVELKVGSLKLSPGVSTPFSQSTTPGYQISKPGRITLKVCNVAGQAVRTLVNEYKPTGRYEVQWDGRDDGNLRLSSGIYLIHIQMPEGSWITRAALLR